MKRIAVAIFLGLAGFVADGPAFGQADTALVPFRQFLAEVRAAKPDAFEKAQSAQMQDRSEFGKMRQHILSLYDRVDVDHSFALDGQVFDCVPMAQQPSVRQLGLDKVELKAPAPALVADPGDQERGLERAVSPLTQGLRDTSGNAVRCAQGTIPLRRVTLAEMTRFRTLEGFFHKTPDGGVLGEEDGTKAAVARHKYAHAAQAIKNYGGNSVLSLWSPAVDTNLGEIFSLSQHWYAGGTGAKLQTVEGGWQVYPAKYRTTNAALFIYWTADGYNNTGCYNLDCAGFVQTSSNWALGGTFSNYSVQGGRQVSVQMQWKLADGRWWLYLQGNGAYEAVGYYPVSLYRGGQLARFATLVDYGGETVGTTEWPAMGSGAFASAGAGAAAYQSQIFYIKAPASKAGGVWTTLKVFQPSPSCYRLLFSRAAKSNPDGSYFYFGGPGGGDC